MTILRPNQLRDNSNHTVNTKTIQTLMTEKYKTYTNLLRAPTEITDRGCMSGQYANLNPVILQTPRFTTIPQKRHHQWSLETDSVLYRCENKGPFIVKFWNLILDVGLFLLLEPLTRDNTCITSSDIRWEKSLTIFLAKSQMMLLLKVSLQFLDPTRCHFNILLTKHAIKAKFIAQKTIGFSGKTLCKGCPR